MRIIVGTAGFSYADWRGPFYPPDLPQKAMLEYYATRFPAVELDYTYYRMPEARHLAAMAGRTPESFVYCVKAYRAMTHERPEAADEMRAVFAQFAAAVEPLSEAGRLGCVLLQFPWSFKPTAESAAYLRVCRDLLPGLPAVVELRNSDWVREPLRPRLMDLLREAGMGFCCVDEPRLQGLMPPIIDRAGEPAYVRFHGRNAKKWWKHESATERYDYQYSQAELAEWAGKIRRLAGEAERTFVFFNNCHAGQAATNAAEMMGLLGQRPPG
jgi:uncharacterized protein YecE (DUF72 family)